MNNSTYIIIIHVHVVFTILPMLSIYMNNYIRVHTMTQSELAYTCTCTYMYIHACLQYIHANDKYIPNQN